MILLRDDDPNSTTRHERLARVYSPLLDAGYLLNFAVIPEIALDALVLMGRRRDLLIRAFRTQATPYRYYPIRS
ncbi:MAG: hypothetical protein WAK20_00470 [Candidatus Acidiferrum sp.]